jgi:hypothetical protein
MAVHGAMTLLLFHAALNPQGRTLEVEVKMYEQCPIRRQREVLLVLVAFVLLHGLAAAQGLTGTLIGTARTTRGASCESRRSPQLPA